jgi:hypothetical protein
VALIVADVFGPQAHGPRSRRGAGEELGWHEVDPQPAESAGDIDARLIPWLVGGNGWR